MWTMRVRRSVLAAILGLGVLAGLARGQGPVLIDPGQSHATPGVIVEECSDCQQPIMSRLTPKRGLSPGKPHRPLANRKIPPRPEDGFPGEKAVIGYPRQHVPLLCCYSHINDYTCGNLRNEVLFVFGSCRWFFNEKCLQGPPPPMPHLQKAAVVVPAP